MIRKLVLTLYKHLLFKGGVIVDKLTEIEMAMIQKDIQKQQGRKFSYSNHSVVCGNCCIARRRINLQSICRKE